MSADEGEDTSSPSGAEPGEQAYAVVDEENYTHNRRQQLIEDYREQALEVRTEARSQVIAGQVGYRQARRFYRSAVESYLLQLVPVLRRDDVEFDRDYLAGIELGSVHFEPPEDLVEYAEENLVRLPDGESVPTAKRIDLVGFEDVLNAESPITVPFSVSTLKGHKIETEDAHVQREIPETILDEVLQKADEALNEIDIGIKTDVKQKQTKITDEHIDELEEWRQQNIN